jgi:hypothetical protein
VGDPESTVKLSERVSVRYTEQQLWVRLYDLKHLNDVGPMLLFAPVRYYGLLKASFSQLIQDYLPAITNRFIIWFQI